jgi:hypothetical protein
MMITGRIRRARVRPAESIVLPFAVVGSLTAPKRVPEVIGSMNRTKIVRPSIP